MKYFIGTSGWNYAHWKQQVYNNAPAAQWLELYTKIFSTVEVNNTFYRWPTKTVLESWFNRTPANFRFTLKIPRSISHRSEMNPEDIKSFYDLTSAMKDKIGCYLFQFPPRFDKSPENIDRLKRYLDAMDSKKDNAIEFRHVSWWNEEIYDMLNQYNVAFVSVSGLKMPKEMISSANFAYVRLHGERYDTLYTKKELNEIAFEIKKMKGIQRVYAYFDNDQNAFAPQNARELLEILG